MGVLAAVAAFITTTISTFGYGGIIILMAIESANIPLPSEVIMPFAGFLVSTGRFSLLLAALAGAIGCTLGSAFSYWIGAIGGRPLVERYGKYVLISKHDLDLGEHWFARWGDPIAFFSRLLPVVRTFISFPIGIARAHFRRFLAYTFAGSFLWSLVLAWVGIKIGQNRQLLSAWFHRFDAVIIALIVLGAIWWIWRHIKNTK